jgi:hypothetical protein
MFCKECNGRVFIDRVFSQKMRIELFCILCGKRWMIKKDGNAFGEWLLGKEKSLSKKSYIFT